MTAETFEERFLNDLDSRSGKGEIPGDAQPSVIEIASMRTLLRATGNTEEARRVIVEHGFPLLRDEIGPETLGETAYKHLCVVAPYLYRQRGEAATADTVESYITKNRFDRWVGFNLIKSGKMDGAIKEQWYSPQDRQPGYENVREVQYPEGVDNTKIFGIAKPHRYWPAQLMRYLEYMRLGKITSQEEMDKLGLVKGEEEKYRIEWDRFSAVLENAESVDEIAVGIAVKTMEILKERKIDDARIVKVILAGYSPGGPMNEHGNIPQVHEIWGSIVERVADNEKLCSMKEGLILGVKEKMSKTGEGYEFAYKPPR